MAFISFRGKIRYGFVSFVCYSFRKEKIPFIIDEEFQRGRDIKKEIEEAIEKAEVLIPIICEDYATSEWCLDELVLIVKYHETKHILPVLYHVNQKDVMSQKGCFEKAFDDLGKTYTEEVVNMWRTAFRKIGEFTPHLVRINRHESEVVENITRDVCKMLKRDCSLDTKGPHDATMNIRTAPDQISSQLGSGIPFGNEYPKEKIPARMMTPAEMNSEGGLFIKKEESRMTHAKRNFLESHVADEEEVSLKEMLKQQEAELMAANNILYEAFSLRDRKEKAGECLKEQYCHLQELWYEKMAQVKAETDLKEKQQALENLVSDNDAKLHAARTSKVRLEHKMNLCRGATAQQEDKTKRCIYELKEIRPAFEEAKADVGLALEELNSQIEELLKSCGGLPY